MKAIAVFPGKPNSMHLAELSAAALSDVPDGRGVLVRLLREPGHGDPGPSRGR